MIFECKDNSEKDERLTVGKMYLGRGVKLEQEDREEKDYIVIDRCDDGRAGVFFAHRFRQVDISEIAAAPIRG